MKTGVYLFTLVEFKSGSGVTTFNISGFHSSKLAHACNTTPTRPLDDEYANEYFKCPVMDIGFVKSTSVCSTSLVSHIIGLTPLVVV
jgi:hypothetical protein